MSLAQLYNSSLCGTTPAANGVSAVTVPASGSIAGLTADSVILLTRATNTGTPAGSAFVDTIDGANGRFTIKSVASDTNVYKYIILPSQPQ